LGLGWGDRVPLRVTARDREKLINPRDVREGVKVPFCATGGTHVLCY